MNDDDIRDELQFHLDETEDELRQYGASPEDARAGARRSFGSTALVSENVRDVWVTRWWREFRQDLRYGLRSFRRNPGFIAAAIACLALGIGASTTVISVADATMLRALPYPAPDALMALYEQRPKENVFNNVVSMPDFVDWRSRNRSFSAMAAWVEGNFTYTSENEPERFEGALVTAGYLTLLGVPPRLGRDFTLDDEKPGASLMVIVSDAFWRRNLGASSEALGRTVMLNGRPCTVVGVLPPGFRAPDHAWEVFIALATASTEPFARSSHGHYVVARLSNGATLDSAREDMARISHDLAQEYPNDNLDHAAYVTPLKTAMRGDLRQPSIALLAAAGLVLLIACFNVANLLLARAVTRAREVSVRLALGAGRMRILRQLFTESLLLAVLGAAAGVLLAVGGVQIIRSILPVHPALDPADIRVDRTVLAITTALALLSGVLFGLAPALTGVWAGLNRVMQTAGRDQRTSAGGALMRSTIVVAEAALAVFLLAGAGLLLRSFWTLQSVDMGFRAENVVALQLALPASYTGERYVQFRDELLDRVRSLPEVAGVGLISHLPTSGQNSRLNFAVEGIDHDPKLEPRRANWRLVTPGYFETMRIPLRAGRLLGSTDTASRPIVMVVNETAARLYWPGRNPVGTRARLATMKEWGEVVGVVADVRHFGADQSARPEAYLAFLQAPVALPAVSLVARTEADPRPLMQAVRQQLREIDKNLPPVALRTMEDFVGQSYAPRRFLTLLVLGFATIALALAAGGIYAQLAYAVSQRKHEIGVRMTLGAERGRIVGMILRQGLTVTAIGLIVGMAGVFALSQFIQQVLFGVQALDVWALGSAAAILLATAAVACIIPARRAARNDPASTLRHA